MKRFYALFIISFIAISSCNKKDAATVTPPATEAKILSYSIKQQPFPVNITAGLHTISITFPDSFHNASNLIADFTLSPGCTASINNTKQVSDVSKNNYDAPFTYNISDASGNTTNWTIYSNNNNYTSAWGLGGFLEDSAANNRSYSWYIDQMTTGFDAGENCGPSCVTMACKWADSTFTKTAQDARMKYEPQGGWWSTGDIDSYLYNNNITHQIVSLPATAEDTKAFLKRQVDLKQIVILNIDMNYIRQCQDGYYHVDKFYSTTPGWGHFFIVKGYKEVDNETFFEIYDPYSWGDVNTDYSLKGKDRYYRYEDVFAASNVWWQYAFIIAKNGTALSEKITHPSTKNIPVQYGR